MFQRCTRQPQQGEVLVRCGPSPERAPSRPGQSSAKRSRELALSELREGGRDSTRAAAAGHRPRRRVLVHRLDKLVQGQRARQGPAQVGTAIESRPPSTPRSPLAPALPTSLAPFPRLSPRCRSFPSTRPRCLGHLTLPLPTHRARLALACRPARTLPVCRRVHLLPATHAPPPGPSLLPPLLPNSQRLPGTVQSILHRVHSSLRRAVSSTSGPLSPLDKVGARAPLPLGPLGPLAPLLAVRTPIQSHKSRAEVRPASLPALSRGPRASRRAIARAVGAYALLADAARGALKSCTGGPEGA